MDPSTSPWPGSPSATTTFRIPQHVVHRAFASETVLLNLGTGKYYGVNPTGGRMLEVLEAAESQEVAAAILAEEFEVAVDQIRQDLFQFCQDLTELGLLEPVSSADAA